MDCIRNRFYKSLFVSLLAAFPVCANFSPDENLKSEFGGLLESQWYFLPSHAFFIKDFSMHFDHGIYSNPEISHKLFHLQGQWNQLRIGYNYFSFNKGKQYYSYHNRYRISAHSAIIGLRQEILQAFSVGAAWKQGIVESYVFGFDRLYYNQSSLGVNTSYFFSGYYYFFAVDFLNLFASEGSFTSAMYCTRIPSTSETICPDFKRIYSFAVTPEHETGLTFSISNRADALLKYDFPWVFLHLIVPIDHKFLVDFKRNTFVGGGYRWKNNHYTVAGIVNYSHGSWSSNDEQHYQSYFLRMGLKLSVSTEKLIEIF